MKIQPLHLIIALMFSTQVLALPKVTLHTVTPHIIESTSKYMGQITPVQSIEIPTEVTGEVAAKLKSLSKKAKEKVLMYSRLEQ